MNLLSYEQYCRETDATHHQRQCQAAYARIQKARAKAKADIMAAMSTLRDAILCEVDEVGVGSHVDDKSCEGMVVDLVNEELFNVVYAIREEGGL